MNWDVNQLRAYTMRRLNSEQRAREKIQAAEMATRIAPKDFRVMDRQQRGIEKSRSRNGYSLPVVLTWMREMGIPEPVFEYRFCERMWRWDIAWVTPYKLACEVNGGVFVQGRHNRGAALLAEYEKLSKGAALGWRVIFTTPDRLCTASVAETIRQALGV